MQVQHEKDIIPMDLCSDESGIMEGFGINSSRKPEAFIDNWWYDGQRLWGKVSKHPTQHEFKQDCQATSYVIELDLEQGFAETENTFYRLGKPNYLIQNET